MTSSPKAPHSDARRDLIATLRRLETDPEGHEEHRRRLGYWLNDPERSDRGDHLKLNQLQSLARRREREGRDFQLPGHLHSCRMCMELFQVIRMDLTSGTHSTRKSDRSSSSNLLKEEKESPDPKKRTWIRSLLWAAALVLVFVIGYGLLRPPTLIIESGVLQTENRSIESGRIPGRTTLEALQPTRVSLLDGSSITLEPGTRIRIGKTLSLQPTLTLLEGSLEIHLTEESTSWTLATPEEILRVQPGEKKTRTSHL